MHHASVEEGREERQMEVRTCKMVAHALGNGSRAQSMLTSLTKVMGQIGGAQRQCMLAVCTAMDS